MKTLLALALALQIPSQAFACRIGVDQQLFEQPPPTDALPGAQIIRVRFTNARPDIKGLARHVESPDGSQLSYTLIGVAQRIDEDVAGAKPFPVYAFVTSCSFFWSMSFGEVSRVVDGDYYLIGRFTSDARGQRFHAGGRRTTHGEDLYGGFHF
nr:hypothetical protein [uncultured Sphingosinicella sp.]